MLQDVFRELPRWDELGFEEAFCCVDSLGVDDIPRKFSAGAHGVSPSCII